MQISIIIPIYNVEAYIERCIQSVIAQTFTDYEIILVDDDSPDNALQIAEKVLMENKIAFQTLKHKTNQGLSEARNSGMKVAKGKYIMFLDSDDELSHNEVLTQFYETIEREKVDFITTNFKVIYSKKDIRTGKGATEKEIAYQGKSILENFLQEKFSMSAWNKLINKDFLFQNDLFFEKGLTCEDEWWTFQMCIVAKKMYCLPQFNYNYYKNNLNSITKNVDEQYYESNIYILKKQLEIAKEKQLINPKNANAFIFHFKRMSKKILPPKLLNDKKLWLKNYTKLRDIYQQSELWQYKKQFRFPAHIAYFIRKEKHKNWKDKGNESYGKLLNVLHRYNEG